MPGTFTSIGWTWMVVGGRGRAHLVPRTILVRSRTACHRPLADVALTEPLPFADDERCYSCRRANGDV